MKTIMAPTWQASIYVAGDRATIEQTCREFCFNLADGFCVSVESVSFIYTGGGESGCRVGIVNYPRFPESAYELTDKARRLAKMLLKRCHQWSVLIVMPDYSEWMTRRDATV